MIDDKDTALKVAEYLLQINAIKIKPKEPFQWASGWHSPIYCDNRLVLSYPKIRNYIRQSLVKIINDHYENINCVAGVATGGIALGALVAQELGLPFVYIRPSAKKHGLENRIEGHLEEGSNVIVIEDLISTGGSSLNAVRAIKESKSFVKGLLANFTYDFDISKKDFKKEDCDFYTLSDYDHLIEKALGTRYIQKEDVKTLEEWRKDPENWGK